MWARNGFIKQVYYKTSVFASYWRCSLLVTNDGAMFAQCVCVLGGGYGFMFTPFNFYVDEFFTLFKKSIYFPLAKWPLPSTPTIEPPKLH